jgi:hypothetical protein
VAEETLVIVGPPLLFDKGVLDDVAEVLAGAGGEVLFGAGTLAAGAELLLEGAVEGAPVPGTGVITTLPFTDLISTWPPPPPPAGGT